MNLLFGLVLLALPNAMPLEPELYRIEPPPRPQMYVTSYNWELGGANCSYDFEAQAHDCGHTSLVPTGPELLGRVAGCPRAWLGHITTKVIHILGYEFWCVDTFGSLIDQGLLEIDGVRVFRLDVAWKVPREWPYNNVFVEEYWTEWRPLSEFRALREAWKAELVTAN